MGCGMWARLAWSPSSVTSWLDGRESASPERSGRYMAKVLPRSISLETSRSSPPRRSASSRLIDSPSPVPPYLREVPVSAC
ncbi:hypothetical protein D3C84_450270 [compost metagenome]